MEEINLKITTPQINLVTGFPIVIKDLKRFEELGIKSEQDVMDNIDKLEKVKLGTVINSMFDVVSLPTREIFAVYSDISIKIRKALQDKKSTITISIHDLEALKKLFEMPPKDKQVLNSQFAFVHSELDEAYVKAKAKTK